MQEEWSQNLTLLKAAPAVVSPDKEKAAFERTKKFLKVRSLGVAMGLLFALLPVSVTYSRAEGLEWLFWRPDFPRPAALAIAAVCLANAAISWGLYF